jgi:hypothetical protein
VTATITPTTTPAAAAPRTPKKTIAWRRGLLSWPALVGAAALGIIGVGLSYRLSAEGAAPGLYYVVFWLGMLVAALPVTAAIVAPGTTQARRMWAVALLGVVTFAPKYLRNPFAPAYHDEYAHWREATDVLSSGTLLRPNFLIPIIQSFPGTSALTAAVEQLTGLSVWSSGQVLELTTHLLCLFAVAVLAQAHLRSASAGGIAAVVYGVNPSAVYFDTQYSYEGIAIALFLWVLALTSLAARAEHRRRRITLAVGAVVCGAAAVVTHHLTTLFLLLLLLGVATAMTVWRRWRHTADHGARVWWAVFGGIAVVAAAWLMLFAEATVAYLSPYFGGSVHQLTDIAAKKADSGRKLLAPSVQPLWERGLTALAPVVIGLVCLRAVALVRRARPDWRADTYALTVFGLIYFPSVLFLVAPSGAEGARRSWAFTYAGIALIAAAVVQKRRNAAPVRWRQPVTLAVAAILLMGNVGGGLNDPYRFPGPFRWGTDTNSASAEARTVAEALTREAGPVRAVADRYTSLQLIAYGGIDVATPSEGFPAALLVQSPDDPSRSLAGMLYASHYDYVVVDTRMAQQAAFNGDNFGSSDPLPGRATPQAYLDRLDAVPWASRIISTEHLRVYRLDLLLLGQTLRSGS